MTKTDLPRITFGMIVLNGQPFIRYNLRALYPFAHQIIVVEGAVSTAAEIATDKGHSRDGSLDELYRFKTEEDPENKLEIVTCEGFWKEKDEMSQAYAERASGNYLWQVDVDEFYHPWAIRRIISLLRSNPQITAISFKQLAFWGSFDYLADGWYFRQGAHIFHRLFKWEPGYRYVKHRPPTVVDSRGQDLRDLHYFDGRELARQSVYLYHYSLLFPQQVLDKSRYYGASEWANRPHAEKWAREAFLKLHRPFQVHNVYHYPSWLERYEGQHPPQIEAMRRDLEQNILQEKMRPTEDIERLLDQPWYRLGRFGLKALEPIARRAVFARRRWRRRYGIEKQPNPTSEKHESI